MAGSKLAFLVDEVGNGSILDLRVTLADVEVLTPKLARLDVLDELDELDDPDTSLVTPANKLVRRRFLIETVSILLKRIALLRGNSQRGELY